MTIKVNKFFIILIILLVRTIAAIGQCSASYSYSGNSDTLTFTNESTVSNAHFYWNFGDGSGSNEFSPTHIFPDDGKYLVTLYGADTLGN
jgi:PKD repeat protein